MTDAKAEEVALKTLSLSSKAESLVRLEERTVLASEYVALHNEGPDSA